MLVVTRLGAFMVLSMVLAPCFHCFVGVLHLFLIVYIVFIVLSCCFIVVAIVLACLPCFVYGVGLAVYGFGLAFHGDVYKENNRLHTTFPSSRLKNRTAPLEPCRSLAK